jgi:hypothetical protein
MWFGHVKRMDEHRITETFLEIKISGRRSRDRPCTRWVDQVKKDVQRRGQDWRTAV